jgi:hypothetical protein
LNCPVTTVITINKVQDVYNTPVYNTSTSEADCLLELNNILFSNTDLDLEFYKRQMFNAVHIGDFMLKGKYKPKPKMIVGIIMPVFNTKV